MHWASPPLERSTGPVQAEGSSACLAGGSYCWVHSHRAGFHNCRPQGHLSQETAESCPPTVCQTELKHSPSGHVILKQVEGHRHPSLLITPMAEPVAAILALGPLPQLKKKGQVTQGGPQHHARSSSAPFPQCAWRNRRVLLPRALFRRPHPWAPAHTGKGEIFIAGSDSLTKHHPEEVHLRGPEEHKGFGFVPSPGL